MEHRIWRGWNETMEYRMKGKEGKHSKYRMEGKDENQWSIGWRGGNETIHFQYIGALRE